MDYMPPPPIEYTVSPVSAQTPTVDNGLTLSIDAAEYNAEKKTAHITMHNAFEKSGQIQRHKGERVTFRYQQSALELKSCPYVQVSINTVERHINISSDTVTLDISDVSQSLADDIERQKCFFIDTSFAKIVSAVTFPPIGREPVNYHKLNR